MQTVCARTLALLERHGVLEDPLAPRLTDDGFAEREPALASLATAAVTGNPPDALRDTRRGADPEARSRGPIRLRSDATDASVSGLSARQGGFSLHAATTKCGSRLALRALVTAAESVARRASRYPKGCFLTGIGEDPNPPPIAPARGPPFFRMPALRRALGELDSTQRELFGA